MPHFGELNLQHLNTVYLRLDGGNTMLADFNLGPLNNVVFDDTAIIHKEADYFIALIDSDHELIDLLLDTIEVEGDVDLYGNISGMNATIGIKTFIGVASRVNFQSHTGVGYQVAAGLVGGYFEILRGGGITMLDDMMIDLGNETTGAAANVANRGKLRFVEGGAGVHDHLYICMKGDAGGYSWIEICDGGA